MQEPEREEHHDDDSRSGESNLDAVIALDLVQRLIGGRARRHALDGVAAEGVPLAVDDSDERVADLGRPLIGRGGHAQDDTSTARLHPLVVEVDLDRAIVRGAAH